MTMSCKSKLLIFLGGAEGFRVSWRGGAGGSACLGEVSRSFLAKSFLLPTQGDNR
jgi:hypothetical protein